MARLNQFFRNRLIVGEGIFSLAFFIRIYCLQSQTCFRNMSGSILFKHLQMSGSHVFLHAHICAQHIRYIPCITPKYFVLVVAAPHRYFFCKKIDFFENCLAISNILIIRIFLAFFRFFLQCVKLRIQDQTQVAWSQVRMRVRGKKWLSRPPDVANSTGDVAVSRNWLLWLNWGGKDC